MEIEELYDGFHAVCTNMDKRGHFCLQLKKNQRAMFDDVPLFFGDMEKNRRKEFRDLASFREIKKDHGMMERREYYVFCNPKEIVEMLAPKWVHGKCPGMARLTRNDGESVSRETHSHLLDKLVGAEDYAGLARGHWAIENSLHWGAGYGEGFICVSLGKSCPRPVAIANHFWHNFYFLS